MTLLRKFDSFDKSTLPLTTIIDMLETSAKEVRLSIHKHVKEKNFRIRKTDKNRVSTLMINGLEKS
jgi:hypothetical protein